MEKFNCNKKDCTETIEIEMPVSIKISPEEVSWWCTTHIQEVCTHNYNKLGICEICGYMHMIARN